MLPVRRRHQTSKSCHEGLAAMKELVGSCNVYGEGAANIHLVALYPMDMMKVFGVVPDSTRLGFPMDQQTTDEVHACTTVL